LVDESVKDRLVSALSADLEGMRAGEPAKQRIVNSRQFGRLSGLLEEVRDRVVSGGSASEGAVAPTVVVDPPSDSALMQQEIFGPILPVIGVGSLDEAISYVNSR